MEESTRHGAGQISLLKYGSRAVHTIHPKQNLPAVSMMVWRANCVFDAGKNVLSLYPPVWRAVVFIKVWPTTHFLLHQKHNLPAADISD